jgi:superfamily II DNA or RNA helicase
MNVFPETVQFRQPWRAYQERVLRALDEHLADHHFHVVAAPGSGKTVLGLEAMRRLGQPALILAPTRGIRDQWIARLCELFLGCSEVPEWVSTNLAEPGRVTVSTYQALFATSRRLPLRQLVKQLESAGVRTLVLDEAHHLRTQWWKCLDELKRGLQSPRIIALTATPPYDVSQLEWSRYLDLCGPIDAEVPVPELVQAGNLCPHQDYLYFSTPSDSERRHLADFDRHVRQFLTDLALNREFAALLAQHPVLRDPEQYLDRILERSDYHLSLAIYLHETAPEASRPLLRVMGLTGAKLPAFQRDWAELMLNGLLFDRDPHLNGNPPLLDSITRELRRIGAVDHRQIHLRAPPRLRRVLEGSANKCSSIADIIEMESRDQPIGMRAVILCDHIRESDFPKPGDRDLPFTRLGVVPVFEHLRRLRLPDVRPGIVTGRVTVIPAAAERALDDAVNRDGQPLATWRREPLWHAPEFLRVHASDRDSGRVLEAITRLFTAGEINTLVGTASLLGEGWDAPAVNTLILATTIGASMSSNQMRGRAIRVQPGNPGKTANIWHLACLTDSTDSTDAAGSDPDTARVGADFEGLVRRFRSFAGLAYDAPVVENGIERLNLDPDNVRTTDVPRQNSVMSRRALHRDALRTDWNAALDVRDTSSRRMVVETLIPTDRVFRRPVLAHWLRWEPAWLRWWKEMRLRRRLTRIARALLESLTGQRLIETAPKRLRIGVRVGTRGAYCRLDGASTHEESFFGETLRELFDLLASPRYLLQHRASFHAVPRCLGENRDKAASFQSAWQRHVQRVELIYTRTAEGRRALLRAREGYLASRHGAESESRTRWG